MDRFEVEPIVIRKCVKRYNDGTDSESEGVYEKSVDELGKLALQDITKASVELIVRPFLLEWGHMRRVLGRSKYKGWENRLAPWIQHNQEKLQKLRTSSIADDYDLDESSADIMELYKSVKKAFKDSGVSAAKTLHLICPSFFLAWDSAIEKAFHKELEKSVMEFSGEEYFEFMKKMQGLTRRYDVVFSELAGKYEIQKVKVLDEFLWTLCNRPLCLF
ncbi:MAG: hypothetical protein ABSB28_09160 [Candidatus Bathyarchaeia archaeon]